MTILFFNLSSGEILFVVLIALLLFGPKQLMTVAHKAGKILFDVRKATDSIKKEITQPIDEANIVMEETDKKVEEINHDLNHKK